jgi:hypothetical protein
VWCGDERGAKRRERVKVFLWNKSLSIIPCTVFHSDYDTEALTEKHVLVSENRLVNANNVESFCHLNDVFASAFQPLRPYFNFLNNAFEQEG